MFPATFPQPHGWIFLSGHFAGTNQMLHDQRSAGSYQERWKAVPYRLSAYDRYTADRYAAEVRRIVTLARDEAAVCPMLCSDVWLGFALLGTCHHRLDPSAWYLPGKAAEDGLVRGRLLRSDRSQVLATMGTVAQSQERSAEIWSWVTGRRWITGTQGMLIMWWLG